jgi:hypothetical protein
LREQCGRRLRRCADSSHAEGVAADETFMSAVSPSTSNTGITDLMQLLSNAATPAVSSMLSSKTMQAGLAKAPPADIAQLSDQAMQLQEADGLFGAPAATATESSGMAMQDLLTSIYSGKTVNVLG